MKIKDIEKLLNQYDRLPESQKQVLELRSLLYELKNKSSFGLEVKRFCVPIGEGKTINTGSGPKLSCELENLGYLDNKHNVFPTIIHPLTMKALDKSNPRRDINLKVTRGIYPLKDLDLCYEGYSDKSLSNQAVLHGVIHENKDKLLLEDSEGQNIYYQSELLYVLKQMYGKEKVDIDWLQSRKEVIKAWIYAIKLASDISITSKPQDYKIIYQQYEQESFTKLKHGYLSYLLIQVDIVSGELGRAVKKTDALSEADAAYYLTSSATILFFKGEFDAAIALYKKGLTAFRKYHGKRSWFFEDVHGVFFMLLLLYHENSITEVKKHITNTDKKILGLDTLDFYNVISVFIELKLSCRSAALLIFKSLSKKSSNLFYKAIYHLAHYALDSEALAENIDQLKLDHKASINQKQLLAASICGELLRITTNDTQYHVAIDGKNIDFLSLIEVREPWEYTLANLEELFLEKSYQNDNVSQEGKRLVWLLNPEEESIEVIEQSLGKKGWSNGRAVSLKRLYGDQASYTFLTEQDKLALEGLRRESDNWYRHDYIYSFSAKKTLRNLIGHQNIYHFENRNVPIEIIEGEAEIYIENKDDSYSFNLSHASSSKGYIFEQESMNRYKYIPLTAEYKKIASIITNKGLILPSKAKDRVLGIIEHAKKDIKLHSGIEDVDIPILASNTVLSIQLLPIGESIQISIWIRPFGEQGPYCKVSHGKKVIIATIMQDNKEIKYKVKRDFTKETQSLKKLLNKCSELSSYHMDSNVYVIDELEYILETLSDLESLKSDKQIMIEWPQGEKYKIKNKLSGSNLSIQIKSENNWFEYDGEVQVNEHQVLEMKVLLESLEDSPGRFISLSNGEFIELTASFRKQLGVLENISQGNRVYHLNAMTLKDLADEIDALTVDTGWEQHVKRLKKMEKHNPKIPSTLKAQLRDYQEDGYKYLSSLANWGIGSCLADDMGLGKTIQAISLILEHAPKGPTLVIAPTSVCFNWIEEIKKFAPTLNAHLMYELDRDEGVKKLTSMDVLVCSYGLLHHNNEVMSKKKWQTIILDEAQAIKNPQTRRWKSVMSLNSKVRVALTGTPIENHLGELWSIFNFINPGMLGSLKHFQNRFSLPIERDKNTQKMHSLRTLVQPYILRRLKSEVLNELPPKTSQTIYIEPSDEEVAFYDALRRNASEKILSMDKSNPIAILAEISKLRQACCDSSMVNADVNIENSKLRYFKDLLCNIIDNGHKVLVFSQYVKFLVKVQDVLQENAVKYQYIDGSTPQNKRSEAVQAFQSGEGDAFILSLKAGGSGLNLTAADYVIHLDPWWNPAVEDQASDRAHRIGQERPVTIYRLIMKNTIEEKIINLHKSKRDLANDLLSEQGIGGKLSEQDLLELITG